MRCVEFRTQLLSGIRKRLSPWQLKAAVQVILNTFLVIHVWAKTVYATLLWSPCVQVYICALPSLKLLFALLFAPLRMLVPRTDFLHLWAVAVPSVHLAQSLSPCER